METEKTGVETLLTTEQRKRLHSILRATPTVAHPHHGMGKYPTTVEGMLDTLEHLVGYLRFEMNEHEKHTEELANVKRDIAAVGRLMKLMQGEP